MLQKACQVSWRVGNLKLLAWRPATGKSWQYALFDIHQDQGENENIADEMPQAFSQMFKDMWKWAEGVYESQLSETQCAKDDASVPVCSLSMWQADFLVRVTYVVRLYLS